MNSSSHSFPRESLSLRVLVRDVIRDEAGQDLIEYALVAALLGLAAIATMKTLSSKIGNAFGTIGSTFSSNI